MREVNLDSGGTRLAEINAAVEGKDVSMELTSGKTLSGLKLEVGSDTTCWTEWDRSPIKDGDEERVCVPTSEVHKITVHRRLKGCLVGGGIGLGAGIAAVVLPLVVLALSGDVGDDGQLAVAAIIAVGLGGAIGTGIGAAIGAVSGEDVYILNP